MMDKKNNSSKRKNENNQLLLLSLESYCCKDNNDDDKVKKSDLSLPSRTSIGCTVAFIFIFLYLVEFTLRKILISIQDFHPLLQDETNRNILARHIGVDALCCLVVASMGWNARHIIQDVWKKNDAKEKNERRTATTSRVFQYYPEGARILVFFTGFQCKNLVDTIVWKDGPEYIMHHILSIVSSVGGLVPGACHFYAIFYMGLSEASTGILCLLANFEEDGHGVPGLADAFPNTKLVLGTIFAISFVYIRIYLWMKLTISYFFPDIRRALFQQHPNKSILTDDKKIFLYLNSLSLGIVTLLQIIWLFAIFRIIALELLG